MCSSPQAGADVTTQLQMLGLPTGSPATLASRGKATFRNSAADIPQLACCIGALDNQTLLHLLLSPEGLKAEAVTREKVAFSGIL